MKTLFKCTIIFISLCLNGSSSEHLTYSSISGGNTLVIGGIVPVHKTWMGGCGKVADYGVQYAEAIAYAVKSINSNPALFPGMQPLSFEIRDSCERVYTALEQTFLLLSSKSAADNNISYGVSGVVGESESLTSIAIANLLHVFNVPQIDFGATAPSLSDKSRYDYFLRTVPPDNFQARALVDVLDHFGWTYVVAVNSGDIYGREGIADFVKYYHGRSSNSSKRCIARQLIEIPYPDASAEDYDRAANVLLQPYVANATAIVLFGQTETAQGLMDAMQRKSRQFAGRQYVWVGTDGWAGYLDEDHRRLAKYVISTSHKTQNDSGFEAYFRSLRPESAPNPWFRAYWEEYNCSRAAPPGGLCTPVDTYVPQTINAVYAFAHAARAMQKALCGPVGGACPAILKSDRGPTTLNGSLLLQYLKNVSFAGVAGNVVSFDQNGDPKIVEYEINYLHPVPGSVSDQVPMMESQIGTWKATPTGRLLSLREPLPEVLQHQVPCSAPCRTGYYRQFVEGEPDCCWVCQPCPGASDISDGKICTACSVGFMPNPRRNECHSIPVDFFSIPNPWAVTAILIGGFGIAVTWVAIVMLAVNHAHAVVKASSRELIALLLVGVHLCYVMPFFFILRPSVPICTVRRLGVGVSFSLCFSALLVRTVRIHRIFNRDVLTNQLVCVKPVSQVVFTLVLVAVQVIISVVWLGVEQPAVRSVFSGTTGELKCSENSYVGLSLTLGYNAMLLLLATYYAFRTRNVPQNFNETKFISLTVYSLVVIWIAFLPVYFGTANLGTVFQISSVTLAVVLSSTVLLGCLVVTKVYYLLWNLRISPQAVPAHQQHHQRSDSLCISSTKSTAICMDEKCPDDALSLTARAPMSVICVPAAASKMIDMFTQTE